MALSMLWHDALHVIIALVAGILFFISLITYLRTRRGKFLFICSAFLVFAIKEIILAVNIISVGADPIVVLTHALDLVILLLFAAGILK